PHRSLSVFLRQSLDQLFRGHKHSARWHDCEAQPGQCKKPNRWITTLAAQQGRRRLGRHRRLHRHQSDDRRIGHCLPQQQQQQQKQRLACGARAIEWAFLPNWSAKLEYDFLGWTAGHLLFQLGSLPATLSPRAIATSQMVKVGISYLFNWSRGY